MRVVAYAVLLILGTTPSMAQSRLSQPTPRDLPSVDSLFRAESQRTRESLDRVRASVDSLQHTKKPVAEVWGPILVGLVAAAAGFAAAAFSTERSVRSAREGHLYDALKWFEGETQKRSIGLSVIEGNWKNKALHPTWRGVLVNQAVFLLASSKTDTEHERQNLHRIRALLARLKLDEFDRGALFAALTKRAQFGGGVPNVNLGDWQNLGAA
ncbi:MAG: hypothetical protein JWM27_2271 [Gemmatimonadetes bacterium]|nr:hypothetical protein [Gemmatimonadota bacterium]